MDLRSLPTIGTRTRPDGVLCVSVAGLIDHDSAPSVREQIWPMLDTHPGGVALDVSGLVLSDDGADIEAIVSAQARAQSLGRRLTVGPDDSDVVRMMRFLRLPLENQVFPPVTVANEGDDRLPVDLAAAGAVLGRADQDIDTCFRSLKLGHGDALGWGVSVLLTAVGVASLADPDLRDPKWTAALHLATELADGHLVVACGHSRDVRMGYLPDYVGTGVQVLGDRSIPLSVDDWLVAVELATLTRAVDPARWTPLMLDTNHLPAPDPTDLRAARAYHYARALAAWPGWLGSANPHPELAASAAVFEPTLGDTADEFVAEWQMITALAAADPSAFDTALRQALHSHRQRVARDDGDRLRHLVAYRPAALVALARTAFRKPVTVDSGYLPAGVFH